MASFCGLCGRPLADGEVCTCQAGQNETPRAPYPPRYQQDTGFSAGPQIPVGQTQGFFASMKNRMGIGDPELNASDTYESDKRIVPDCVNANEGEVPVRQYTVAKLRSRVIGIPYATAIGRVQVTNKRVIFRAPGRSIGGRTTLQHEFAIDEIAGVEARREYVFNAFDLFLGFVLLAIGGGIGAAIVSGLHSGSVFGIFALCLLLGAAGCVPFFLMKKHWLIKLLCLGVGLVPMAGMGLSLFEMRRWESGSGFFGVVLMLLALCVLVCVIFALIFQSARPNMVLILKSRFANEAVDIRRRKVSPWASGREEHTGYREVYPEVDTERCIREINALIVDLQENGDAAVGKWRAK